MKYDFDSKQILAGLAVCVLVVTGTYNAIVINSESTISSTDTRFAKRLEEVYKNVESNRGAASISWQKISTKQSALAHQQPSYDPSVASSSDNSTSPISDSQAAVKEDLSLNLTAVINPNKWKQGITSAQFNGNLTTNEGVIESMNVSLPNGEGVSIAFSEMNGNVFEYDFEGSLYSGMMYQEGPHSYVVSLTNGPLEGTRMTFTGEPSVDEQTQIEETRRNVAETDQSDQGMATPEPVKVAEATEQQEMNVDSQNQNVEQPQMMENMYAQDQGQGQLQDPGQADQHLQEQAQAFNFEQPQTAM